MKANDDASLFTQVIPRIRAIHADRRAMTGHALNLTREQQTRRYCSVDHPTTQVGAA
ncbi:hypothetical protein [Azorhizobium oxalatiphilum]|uniref:hypothetical protein n=1 Tax=Azorhizobium oxalatiphilum TaxID=980631 RepID=UPI0016689E3D|nr:hypothetical protein [Azorhizobium oxalatiphilum]